MESWLMTHKNHWVASSGLAWRFSCWNMECFVSYNNKPWYDTNIQMLTMLPIIAPNS